MLECPAVVFEGRLDVGVRQVQLEDPGPGDVLVRTTYSGISAGTERWTLTGQYAGIDETYPFIPGYQRVGVIEWAAPDVTTLAVGQLVFINATRLADPALRDKHWTGHIGYSVAPAYAAIPIPESVSAGAAAVSPLAAVAWNGVRSASVAAGELVVVIGQGLVGNLSAQLARMQGASVVATDLIPERCRLSRAHSADEVVEADPDLLRTTVRRWRKRGADVVIDTSGRSDLLPLMIDLIRPRGRICLQGYYPEPIVIDPHPTHLKQPTILLPCYWVQHQVILQWIARGFLSIEPFITRRFPYTAAPEAYRLLVDDPSAFIAALLDWQDQPALALPPSVRVPSTDGG